MGKTSRTPEEACEKCIGYCCHRFLIPMYGLVTDGKVDWDKYIDRVTHSENEKAVILEQVSAIVFAKENFVQVDKPKEWVREGRMFDEDNIVFACKQYDPVVGTCNSHDRRPVTCRGFLCEPANAGEVPTDKDFEVQARVRAEEELPAIAGVASAVA